MTWLLSAFIVGLVVVFLALLVSSVLFVEDWPFIIREFRMAKRTVPSGIKKWWDDVKASLTEDLDQENNNE